MIDVTTNKPLPVRTGGGYVPYIRLADSQVPEVLAILNKHGIRHSLRESVISMDGGPFIATINLSWEADVNAVQNILDAVQ